MTQFNQSLPPLRKLAGFITGCIAALVMSAPVHSQPAPVKSQKLFLGFRNTGVLTAFNKIESTSDIRFSYNRDDINTDKKITLQPKERTVPELLNEVGEQTGLAFSYADDLVLVKPDRAKKPAAKKIIHDDLTVAGKVTSSSGEALPGVTIKVSGQNIGAVTDAGGNFSLSVPDNAVLIVSYIGFVTKEVPVNGQHVINIILEPSRSGLSEIVVIGYGTQTKKDITGAVSVVSAADIANRPIVDAGEALQGKATGVDVISNSGKPGAGLTIRIRGSSSISAGNDPLYIVDGIPMTDISILNPGDIASISVLKDAASAAIYGTRAANGVVVITTKKGTAGESRINFSTYYGTTSPTKMLPVLNAKQYQAYANEQKGSAVVTDAMVQANDINWPKEVFQNGYQQNYQLSVSGGSEKTQHYISLNYSDQVGMIKPATFDRLNARINVTTKANNWLTFTTSTVVSQSHNNDVTDNASVARGGVVLSALETPPIIPKFNSPANNAILGLTADGAPTGSIGFNPLTGWENPLGAILGSYTKNLTDRLLSNLGADVKLYKGLVFQSRFGIDYGDYTNASFLDPFLTTYGRQTHGQQSRSKTNNLTWLSEQTLNYHADWGRNHFSALAGWTAQDSHTQGTYISGSFLNPAYRLLPWDESYLRDSIKTPGTTSIDDWALISYLGRITYNFDDRYLFQANLRSDQSSKFAPGNRVATFPSFSAGWRISKENFMKDVVAVTDLKLRAGWGQNGNQEGIGSYSYLPLSTIDPISGAVTASTIAPQSLTWETSTQTDIGVDAVFLNGRVSFSGDYYVKKTKNILINIPLPSQAGFSTAPVNAASMQNTGEEFQVSSRNIDTKELKWTTDVNISFNRNKILNIGEAIKFMNGYGGVYARGNSVALVQGYGLGEFYGYIADGVDPATGHQLYLTKTKTKTDNPAASDRVLMGNAQPQFVYGLTNNLSYKNFNLTLFIQGSQGNKIFNAGRLEAEAMVNSANQSAAVLARWQKPGDISDIPGVSKDASTNNSLISTRFLENGSYLRFKTITLSYNIEAAFLSRMGLKDVSVYVSGNNLITITKYKGFDPEVNSYGSIGNSNEDRNISLGLDNGAYPQAKMFLFGLNIGL